MTHDDAEALIANLTREAPPAVHLSIQQGRIVFEGPTRAHAHSLDIGVSSAERVIAHWEGYLDRLRDE